MLHLARPVTERTETATILIVDHDAAVRDALSLTLRSSGFHVCAYASAKAFLCGGPIDGDACLLVDIDLDDMKGTDLLEHLRGMRIELPAVLMTARLRPIVFDHRRSPGVAAILQKPFGQETLLRCIRQALRRA